MEGLKFGTTISMFPTRDFVRAGMLADKYGLDSVWIPDHMTDLPPSGDKAEPWTTLSAIGARTEHVMLSPIVTDTQRRHPAVTAHAVSTLDELTNGRAALALGAGELMNIKPFGLPWEDPQGRADRLAEAVQVIKLLWGSTREKPVDFSGKYYNLTQAWLDQHPVQKPHPKLFVGSLGGPRTLKVIGKYADGWVPWMNTVETFKRRSEKIREVAEQVNRSFDEIDRAVVVFTAATKDERLQKRAIDALKAEIIVVNDRRVLKEMGFDVLIDGSEYKYQKSLPTQERADIASRAASSMPDEIAAEFMVIGDSSQLIEKIDRYIRAGARHVIIRDVIGQYLFGSVDKAEETFRLFAQKVIPYFKGETEKKAK
jgi:alkanesulfonate monooxygenase SsuD/methylene tetrahydromethanopterin reductase-like flavin-dependent oxidoreductase (luciferase family)